MIRNTTKPTRTERTDITIRLNINGEESSRGIGLPPPDDVDFDHAVIYHIEMANESTKHSLIFKLREIGYKI